MNKILLVVGAVLVCVLLLSTWLFIVDFGGFSSFLGKKSQEAVENEKVKFLGTWTTSEHGIFTFFSTGFYRQTAAEGLWVLEDNRLLLFEGERSLPSVTYSYVFSENDHIVQLTDEMTGELLVLTKQ